MGWNGFTGSSGAGRSNWKSGPRPIGDVAEPAHHKKDHPPARLRDYNRDAIGWYVDKAVYIPVDRIADASCGVLSERAIGRMLAERELLARHKKNRLTVDYVPKIGFVPSYALKLAEFSPSTAFESDDDE